MAGNGSSSSGIMAAIGGLAASIDNGGDIWQCWRHQQWRINGGNIKAMKRENTPHQK